MTAEPMRLMTMRVTVIRDGHVIEERPEVEITSSTKPDPYEITSAWPPCRCPRHREGAD
ncbi:hypothetical protein J7I94_25420 [Streptomyces sp. ISL-12]|uniref:hypothetical protein n=1 Tax=Streptomyces sp. ISL-12 TaxID=2819177 RepID=UPI001BEBDA20|nr:hypothetical protein [Streptomyces sp. ISL-12]MBT2413849.1 hypothetical protein [Streptomyces sp. ISL-12]